MNSIASISLSGLNAAQAQLDASAHNVANLATEGFRRQEVVQSEQAGGGVNTTRVQAQQVGDSLETDVVTQLQAKNAFLANLAVFKTADKMAGALFDKTA